MAASSLNSWLLLEYRRFLMERRMDFYGYTGTSAAAPHVAGAAALIKSANPSYSRTQLWDALIAGNG